jgi:hypothetical protein
LNYGGAVQEDSAEEGLVSGTKGGSLSGLGSRGDGDLGSREGRNPFSVDLSDDIGNGLGGGLVSGIKRGGLGELGNLSDGLGRLGDGDGDGLGDITRNLVVDLVVLLVVDCCYDLV